MKRTANVQQQRLQISKQALPSSAQSAMGPEVVSSLPRNIVPEQEDQRVSQIRELAYSLYEARGYLDGRDIEDWLEAEAIIRQKGKLAA